MKPIRHMKTSVNEAQCQQLTPFFVIIVTSYKTKTFSCLQILCKQWCSKAVLEYKLQWYKMIAMVYNIIAL